MIKNYFTQTHAAQRYNAFRPHIHHAIVDRIGAFCAACIPFQSALDVGCGTGHSTYPLLEIANKVTGIDPSPAMLAQAKPQPGINFIEAWAEHLPLPDHHVDLITVGLAFHWLDQPAFLSEAARVLKQGGWLVVYNNWMAGVMVDQPKFTPWVHETYLHRFPTPTRRSAMPEFDFESPFVEVSRDQFDHRVNMSLSQLAGYLTTQSNITRVLLEEKESLQEVTDWLTKELSPFFETNASQCIPFGCKMSYYQLTSG